MQADSLAQLNTTTVDAPNHEIHRKLVAYYRPTQIDYVSKMQVIEIMRFLQYYVEQWYSSLFDMFVIMYRFPDTDLLDEFAQNSSTATGLNFQFLSSIYANTIHFSNGTPDFIPWTLPILWTTPHKRWKHKWENTTIHLPIEYITTGKIWHKHGIISALDQKIVQQQSSPQKLIPTLNIVLKVIQQAEQAMLKMAS